MEKPVNEASPKVSIGVPTLDRPEGLRRTLACLSAQSYRNLEIIVSDNCSPGTATLRVMQEAVRSDSRVRFVRQEQPLGMDGNFRFVLREATGEYFMWAADDDEWDPDFVLRCAGALDTGAISAMTGFVTSYRYTGQRRSNPMPDISASHSTSENLAAFLWRLTPSMFYGLHRREAVEFFLHDSFFDFYDCYFVLRLIASGRVAIIPDELYVAGIDTATYQVKTHAQKERSRLRFSPFYHAVRSVIAGSGLTGVERLRLEAILSVVVIKMALTYRSGVLLRPFRRK